MKTTYNTKSNYIILFLTIKSFNAIMQTKSETSVNADQQIFHTQSLSTKLHQDPHNKPIIQTSKWVK